MVTIYLLIVENREMGLLSALLKWNELDPPSREEKLRNDRICKLYQHNRNPFIDHPEYANLIWKSSISSTPVAYVSSPRAWINEFHYNNKGKDQNELCIFANEKYHVLVCLKHVSTSVQNELSRPNIQYVLLLSNPINKFNVMVG